MQLETAEWQSRLEHTRFKELYYLYEMSNLTQSIGREEILPNADPYSIDFIIRGRSDKRSTLGGRIWRHIDDTYQRTHSSRSDYPWTYGKLEGGLWFVVMLDHWQGSLKQIICGEPRPSLEKQSLWDDSSGEEV